MSSPLKFEISYCTFKMKHFEFACSIAVCFYNFWETWVLVCLNVTMYSKVNMDKLFNAYLQLGFIGGKRSLFWVQILAISELKTAGVKKSELFLNCDFDKKCPFFPIRLISKPKFPIMVVILTSIYNNLTKIIDFWPVSFFFLHQSLAEFSHMNFIVEFDAFRYRQ